MRRNIAAFRDYQVFLNYPFDSDFQSLESALHFPIIAAGLLPVCAKDLSSPDRSRLDMIVDAIINCRYSIHEFSRSTGEGPHNLGRMNMPIEMGMALFHALQTQRQEHRCAFFVPTPHLYRMFASDLSGLDPFVHENDANKIVCAIYDWLRGIVPSAIFNLVPTLEVKNRYRHYLKRLQRLRGSGENHEASYDESRELMYQICEESDWWDWRRTKVGLQEFQRIPLVWK
jgi:hypothetical protein